MPIDTKELIQLAAKLALDQVQGKNMVGTVTKIYQFATSLKNEIAPPRVSRPDWDDYFLGITKAVAERGDCIRRPTGAVIVKDHRIVSTGYNGTPAGGLSCLAGQCPRAQSNVLHGDPDYSNCIALHAEQNAIAYANRFDTDGATIYLTSDPCDMCSKLIRAAGITRVVYGEPLNGTEAPSS